MTIKQIAVINNAIGGLEDEAKKLLDVEHPRASERLLRIARMLDELLQEKTE